MFAGNARAVKFSSRITTHTV